MSIRPVRLATRGLLLIDDRLLLVNAWPDGASKLLCAPGGGTDPEVVVTERHLMTRTEVAAASVKPDSLAAIAWGDKSEAAFYDPLEPILR